ncbi:hypothetical protein J2755_000549 [Methanohalophilus levihalophilus]|uniref:hypothetical protein n=1 Tax=Methanohalophilus levihalophilus TaxID=1431282 RepID=UPI001AE7236A|nr:hypothetical protein [Methanohalophilus levihalophilus]MBP2029629.1 hypothetical protein [Methanohalophilus levihalophilus]
MEDSVKKAIIRDVLIFAIALTVAVIFWKNNLLLTFLIISIYVIRQYFWSIKGDNVVFVTGTALGCAAEFIGTFLGVWTYAEPVFLNIPLWLPFAWGLVSVIIIRVSHPFIEH